LEAIIMGKAAKKSANAQKKIRFCSGGRGASVLGFEKPSGTLG
jgi:hypothetical protein